MRHFRGFILFTTIAIVVVSTSLLTTGEELLSPSTQQQQQSKKGQGKNQNQDPSRKKGQGQGNNQDPARKKGQGQQKNGGNQEKAKGKQGPRHVFAGGAPEHDYDVILARPTDQSITISVLGYKSGKAFVSYGPEGDSVMKKTDIVELKPEFPAEILLSGLEPSRKYRYMISTSFGDANKFQSAEVESFYTQRKPGESFTFGVQADSHLDQGTNSATYELTLANVKKDDPDLFIDLGDTFMTDKYENYHDAEPQYFAQRYYFGLIGKTSPVFLTLGNHDGERMERNLGQGETMSSWSNRLRTRLFPNPVP
ncbi:MAG: hypothetical protein RJA81_699, partial [Planctomycetota bacterium]